MGACSPDFPAVADTLGGIDCATANAVVTLRNPFELANGTLPVVEALMVVGAVVSLAHAIAWWRRKGDPTNLGLWLATVVYVLILEPPLYFPDRFGIEDQVGLIFVHNLFSVQFMYDRLPLYILALYPATTYLAYALVQRIGVFGRCGPWAAAACVGLVFHAFYEIFDNLGPQLLWWAWNPDAPSNELWLESVPLTSAVMFAGASPFGLALLTRWLIARRAERGPIPPASFALRVLGVGALTPLAMIAFSVPFSLVPEESADLRELVLWAEIAALAVAGAAALVVTARMRGEARPGGPGDFSRDTPGDSVRGFLGGYAIWGSVVYLVVFAVLWALALPDHLDAVDGVAPGGGPTGSLGYVVLCAAASLALLGAAVAAARRDRTGLDEEGEESPSKLTGVG
jgi:hypothetical protein